MPEVLHMTHDEHHRALVQRLAAEVKPTRRLWPVALRLGLWMALEVGVLAWVGTHTANHFMEKLKRPVYAIEILFFAAAAVISAALALRSAVPGRALRASVATLAGLLVLAGTLLVAGVEPLDTTHTLGGFVRVGQPCAYSTWMLAALPLLVLWWMVRRGASMSGALSGLLAGAGAALFSFATMRVACPIEEPLHLLTWHLLPALALIAFSTLAGRTWLRFRSRVRPREPARGSSNPAPAPKFGSRKVAKKWRARV
jgi:hypothetical protein